VDGTVIVDFGGSNLGVGANTVALQSNDRIVAAGYFQGHSSAQFAIAQLDANGMLDLSFAGDGTMLVDTGGIARPGRVDLALQTDGRIVVVGVADNLTAGSFALARINPDGTPDTTFGDEGRLTTSFGSDLSAARAVAIQPDGKIVAGGYSISAGFYDFALARYDAGSPLAVDLDSFEATAAHGAVRLTWETASELDNQGFNLWRNSSPDGPAEQLNSALIPSQAPGSSQGFAYTWEDTDVVSGRTYWYWLEDVDLNGTTTLHGPVSVTAGTPTAITISHLSAGNQPTNAWPTWLDTLVRAVREYLAAGFSR
jgi:uncharacterized delta-60 repeat protein